MTVVGGGADFKQGVARNQSFALENPSDRLDLIHWQRGEVGEGAFADASALAVGLAQQDGGRGGAVGDDVDVHAHSYTQ